MVVARKRPQKQVAMDDLKSRTSLEDPNKEWIDHGYRQLPVDLPVFITTYRLMREEKDGVEGLAGWTIECVILNGPKVYIRIGHLPDDTIKVFVEEGEGGPDVVWHGERS